MIPEKLQEILKQDGIVAIATVGQDGPHLVSLFHPPKPACSRPAPNGSRYPMNYAAFSMKSTCTAS